ncbi:hypothetical protein DLB95_23135 [Salmonella enterica subsp. diarizonae]|uniref:Uncharacterized protein n=1 Tax=Salmonella diarizonae TaxID=59204 RepID=A0A5Y3WAK6_SALDZ|nr:hypothetical protein [Salmonella enterica subsp. diarizonae]ECJ2318373.1 hypothetical protein [Salmonella enterica subsp. diarizonae]ECJ4380030.1 hypothetical protein [Salmonella enterica subsp. diarizonae]
MAYLLKYLFLYTVLFKIFSVLQVKFYCFPMNLSSGNWKTDRSIFAENQHDKGRKPGQTVTVCGIMAVALEAFCLMT